MLGVPDWSLASWSRLGYGPEPCLDLPWSFDHSQISGSSDADSLESVQLRTRVRSVLNYHIQMKIQMPNSSQEPSASSKAPNNDLKDMDVLCTFKIKTESQNLDHGCIKDKWPYLNQDQDAKPQSGTSSVLQSPKQWLKGHGCSLHLQNQVDRLSLSWAITVFSLGPDPDPDPDPTQTRKW